MYIIEAPLVPFGLEDEADAFYCMTNPIGSSEQNLRQELEAKLIPLTLGALAVDAIEKYDASALLRNIYEPWRDETFFDIPHDLGATFLAVVQRANLEDRADQCVSQAAKGMLTSKDLAQELAALATVDKAPFATWMTAEGLYSGEDFMTYTGEPIWYSLKDIDSPYDLALAKKLGATGFGWQYQLGFEQDYIDSDDDRECPKLPSDLRHRQLVTLDSEGARTLRATILSPEHPIARQEGYVQSKGMAEATRVIAGLHRPSRNFIETPTDRA